MKSKVLVIDVYSLLSQSINDAQDELALLMASLMNYKSNTSVKVRMDIGQYLVQQDGETANMLSTDVPHIHIIAEGKNPSDLEQFFRVTVATLPSFHFLNLFHFNSKALSKANIRRLNEESITHYSMSIYHHPLTQKRQIKIK